MTKGLRIAFAVHLVGVVFALWLAWNLPDWLPAVATLSGLSIAASKAVLFALALIWAFWKSVKIVAGRDALTNRTAAFFDSRRR
ncbi:hypothetical protein LBW62_19170 [Ralstonia solanacearum]|uniref:hypothetical protein n=1 Tax=Ralstonia solanacearum TaxID=305 RepID=UPI0005C6D4B9|nr:hypothetical protein [Ralstonia solanacearum]MDB0543328.1 hypothetical protein [Ralstonia solanacearum]MDB0553462.1 hypothetical protein [Ralstonia solanacearum]MDB0558307.1 hypothetical protein [Ralstonia solanacearum]